MPSRAWHCDAGVGGALRLSQEGRAGGAAVPAWRRVGFITAASCAGLSCREGCEEPQLGQLLLLEASSLLEPLLSALGSPTELLGAACSLRCPMARLLWGRRVPHRCSVAALPCSPRCAAGLGALSGLCSTSCMRCWEPTGQRLHVVLQPTKGSLRALPARLSSRGWMLGAPSLGPFLQLSSCPGSHCALSTLTLQRVGLEGAHPGGPAWIAASQGMGLLQPGSSFLHGSAG